MAYRVAKTLIWGEPKSTETVIIGDGGEPQKKVNVSVNIVGYEIANSAGKTIILTKDQAAAFVAKKGNGEIENARLASRRNRNGSEAFYLQGIDVSLKDAKYLFRVNTDDGGVKPGYEVFEKTRKSKAGGRKSSAADIAETARKATELFKERGVKIDIGDF